VVGRAGVVVGGGGQGGEGSNFVYCLVGRLAGKCQKAAQHAPPSVCSHTSVFMHGSALTYCCLFSVQ
jgi:hypothetical protein